MRSAITYAIQIYGNCSLDKDFEVNHDHLPGVLITPGNINAPEDLPSQD